MRPPDIFSYYESPTKIHQARARSLRKNTTPAERKLWTLLRRRQLASFRFRRQVPMGIYILDFVCHSTKVIIEADGAQHNEPENKKYDQKRTEWLEQQGYVVLRFWNNQILSTGGAMAVFEKILQACLSRVS